MKQGVYIHIPFCEQRCYYCAFTVATTSEDTYEPYVRRLMEEVRLSGFADEPQSIYFGGGTPSIIPATSIARVLDMLPGSESEVSIEVNPGTISREKLACYRDAGINRVSLGAQSLEDEDLERAGRIHRAAAVFEDFEMFRNLGFKNINLDLIAGLPDQRLEVWTRNVDGVVRLRPEHVSIYMLDQEERSKWGRHVSSIRADEDLAVFYEEAASRLAAAGYVHYEISNWALPGRECRHNLGYWTGVPYRGFGVSSHSFDGEKRFWNTSSLTEYAECIDGGKLPLNGFETLTRPMKFEEAIMLGLRQVGGFDIQVIAEKLEWRIPAEWIARVQELQQEGLIELDGTVLKLTPRGRLVASSVTEELIWASPASHSSIYEATP